MDYFLGVDPGWKNLAYGVVDIDGNYITSGCMNPSELRGGETPSVLFGELGEEICSNLKGAAMERFVYYQGVHNPDSERILMVTGQLQHALFEYDIPTTLFRAIDWKTRLSKHLYRAEGFRNPSDRFDKEFSYAAAECCTGHTFSTDHEADASCLAYIARMLAR